MIFTVLRIYFFVFISLLKYFHYKNIVWVGFLISSWDYLFMCEDLYFYFCRQFMSREYGECCCVVIAIWIIIIFLFGGICDNEYMGKWSLIICLMIYLRTDMPNLFWYIWRINDFTINRGFYDIAERFQFNLFGATMWRFED